MARLPAPDCTVVAESPDHRRPCTGSPCPNAAGENEERTWRVLYSLDAVPWLPAGAGAMSRRPREAYSYALLPPRRSDWLIPARASPDGINRHDTNPETLHRVPRLRGPALDLTLDVP